MNENNNNNNNNPNKKKKAMTVFFYFVSFIVFIICLASTAYFVRARKNYTLNSDDASELVLGKLLADEKSIITKNWYYSTELRVFNTNLIYPLFFKLTNSWHRVHILTCMALYFIFLLSYYVLSRAYKFQKYFLISAALLFIPFSLDYYKIVLKGHYLLYISQIFMILALSEFFLKVNMWRAKLNLCISLILSFFIGLGGARHILILFMPLLVTGILFFVLSSNNECNKNERKKFLLYVCTIFTGSIAGYLINSRILINIYHFKTWEDTSFRYIDFSRIEQVLNSFLTCFRYSTGKLFSTSLIHNTVCLVWLVFPVFIIINSIRNRKKNLPETLRFSIFFLSSVFIFTLFYSFTSARYEDRHSLPVLILVIPMTAIFINHLNWEQMHKAMLMSALVLLTMINGFISFKEFWGIDETEDLRKISQLLVSDGYNNGYSSFWRSNVLTELSNGQIEVWDICEDYDDAAFYYVTDIDQTYHWLQKVSHDYTHPTGKVFLLFTDGEFHYNIWQDNLKEDKIIYRSPEHVVLGYENYDDLINNLYPGYKFNFNNDVWLENGRDIDGYRELNHNGISYGPYITCWPGKYRVEVSGQNLRNTGIFCFSDKGGQAIKIDLTQNTDTSIIYTFSLTEKTKDLETRFVNYSDSDNVVLNSVSITRLTDSFSE